MINHIEKLIRIVMALTFITIFPYIPILVAGYFGLIEYERYHPVVPVMWIVLGYFEILRGAIRNVYIINNTSWEDLFNRYLLGVIMATVVGIGFLIVYPNNLKAEFVGKVFLIGGLAMNDAAWFFLSGDSFSKTDVTNTN